MILATAGHIDHGKTALIRALTGVDADRLPEEKRRGLTIDLGFADDTLPGGHLQKSAHAAARSRAAASASGLFRMPIDRAFTLPGIGLVVTGTIAAGSVAPGDRLVLSPQGTPVRVRGLHGHNRPIEAAAAGGRCAINLAGSFPEGGEPRRGGWILAAERHAPTTRRLL